MTIKVAHSSGRWDRTPELLAANVTRMRAGGRSIVTRTEMGKEAFRDELGRDNTWRFHQPLTDEGFTDCSIEWDTDQWRCEEATVVQLTDIRIHTSRGFPLPFSRMPVALLWNLEAKRHLLVGAAHMALANTELRREAWREEAHAIRRHFTRAHEKHPGWGLLFQGDVNRNQRITALRETVAQHMQRGTKLQNLWEGNLPETGGTHGTRSILDLTLSSLPGRSRLLADDESSDHRPYASELEWP